MSQKQFYAISGENGEIHVLVPRGGIEKKDCGKAFVVDDKVTMRSFGQSWQYFHKWDLPAPFEPGKP
ncbi:hypothetical protein EII17_04500 [Clostridiales bacterium COT073_COT-073]|nr:hypothetical protein EII17_04500 [Clostridiales bacterium COT073_COT-073]